MNGSLPPSLIFVGCTMVAALLRYGLYDGYRLGQISYSRWSYSKVLRYRGAGLPDFKLHYKVVTYRRATNPFLYWLHIGMTAFGFVMCTAGAGLTLFLMIMNW